MFKFKFISNHFYPFIIRLLSVMLKQFISPFEVIIYEVFKCYYQQSDFFHKQVNFLINI